MKNKAIFLVVLTVLTTIVVYSVTNKQQITHQQPTPISTPVPTPNAPKTFNFNSSTDLKAELEKVNPQVLDSDFE